ncbi:MAG: hypothetical protein ACTTJK_10255, partial [Phocaeicola sp.]|uniref:hypothetical protein n=1 Tax=Phocaeicola sp. TaxID=2773926 RepID=UPI003F9F3E9C
VVLPEPRKQTFLHQSESFLTHIVILHLLVDSTTFRLIIIDFKYFLEIKKAFLIIIIIFATNFRDDEN